MNFRLEAACGSHPGRVRPANEDNFFFEGVILPTDNAGQVPPLHFCRHRSEDVCMGVFDGMGGGDYGEVASYLAADTTRNALWNGPDSGQVESFLQNTAISANEAVFREAQRLEATMMGSTQAVLYFSKNAVYSCNVGDSRIFGIRNGRMMQISRDHSEEEYMKQHGITGRKPRLTQYLGMDPGYVQIEPYINRGVVRSGDIYLACSDGLTDMVPEETILEIIQSSDSALTCVQALTEAALDAGGRDNITIIVCRILEEVEKPKEPVQNPVVVSEPASSSFLNRLKKGLLRF